MPRFITVAIHTYDRALALRALLESEGIVVELNNVNLEVPGFSSGVRVRIAETDLPLALRIIENKELFNDSDVEDDKRHMILVPVDLSETSYKATQVAASIAAASRSKITFLYSYIDPYVAGNVQFADALTYEVGENGARAAMKTNAEKLLRNFCDRVRRAMKSGEMPVVKCSNVVVEGVPEDAIVNFAKEYKPRLIVMGTRESSRKADDMIGSVTAEVLDNGRFTVLSVPEPSDTARLLHPSRILMFCNLDQDDILAIDALYRMFGAENAHVTLAHSPSRHSFSEASVKKALATLIDYCRHHFTAYQFDTLLSDNAKVPFDNAVEWSAYDLIVLPNRRRNAFSRLFSPGMPHKILFQTDIPMLVIPV